MSDGSASVEAAFSVSRETMARLAVHVALLERWNPRINLVSAATLPDVWSRHVADSAQLFDLMPPDARRWVDLGAGAGFPGLVVAALAHERRPEVEFRLVESDQRKATFLMTAAREMGLTVAVLPQRAEALPAQAADVVSARALAPLTRLLDSVELHRSPSGMALFPKGEAVHKEIAEAQEHWRFFHRLHPSRTDPRATILEVGAIERAGPPVSGSHHRNHQSKGRSR